LGGKGKELHGVGPNLRGPSKRKALAKKIKAVGKNGQKT